MNQILITTDNCVHCGKPLTGWVKFKRLFWRPTLCPTSFIYKLCCSRSCWEKELNRPMEEITDEDIPPSD